MIQLKPIGNPNWTVRDRVPLSRRIGDYIPVNKQVDAMCFILQGIKYCDVFNDPFHRRDNSGSADRMLANLEKTINPIGGNERQRCRAALGAVQAHAKSDEYTFRRLYTEVSAEADQFRAIFQDLRNDVPAICSPFLDILDRERPQYDTLIDTFLAAWGDCDLFTLYDTSKLEVLAKLSMSGDKEGMRAFHRALQVLQEARNTMVVLSKPNDLKCVNFECVTYNDEWCNEASDGKCSLISG